MAYALAATVSAPIMGMLADRFGRRPVVLVSLAAYVMAFTGYLLASSALAFVILRGAAGALTAGLMPAAMSMVADLAPEQRRGQWIGILSGGASVGWIAGPILGGLLYDRWGYVTAMLISITMATLALVTAAIGIRETRLPNARWMAGLRIHAEIGTKLERGSRLPVSLRRLSIVLFVYFTVMFAWAFIEPRLMYYAYDQLGWSSSMLALVMSTYGVSMALGEFGLGRLSDTLGRKPVIIAGLLLFSAQFIGLALSRDYVFIAAAFVIAGLGNALFDPALSASILDIAPGEHQARLLGMKSTAGSIGNILGPAMIVLFTPLIQAQTVFLVASGMVLLATLLMATIPSGMRTPERGKQFEEAGSPAAKPRTTVGPG